MKRMLRILTKTYKRNGKTIHRKSYLTPDKGKPGRYKGEKWYNPGEPLGWEADMSVKERREIALESRDYDLLATARALQALANVTTSKSTKQEARSDADHFFTLHRRYKEV